MTSSQQAPDVPEPMQTALRGAGRFMGGLSAGPSGKGTTKYDYRSWIEANRNTAYAAMRFWVEKKSEGRLTLRAANRELFARVPDDATMLMVVCSSNMPDGQARPEGRVDELAEADQLYSLSVPEGRMVALEVEKCRRRV